MIAVLVGITGAAWLGLVVLGYVMDVMGDK
jgi:hypothetical protein